MVMGYTCYLCDVVRKMRRRREDDEEVLLDTISEHRTAKDSAFSSASNLRYKNYTRAGTGQYTESKNLISVTPLTISNVRFSHNSSLHSETWNL